MVTHNLSRKGAGMICRELSASFTVLVIYVTLVKILHSMYFSFFLCKVGYIIAILPLRLEYLVSVTILCKGKTLYKCFCIFFIWRKFQKFYLCCSF